MLGLELAQKHFLRQDVPINCISACGGRSRAAIANSLSRCGKAKDLRAGQHEHNHIVQTGLDGIPIFGGLLVHMYGKCDALLEAQSLFSALSARHVHLWSSMIKSCASLGHTDDALQLFHQMHQEAILPIQATYVCTLSACANHSTLTNGTLIHCCIAGGSLSTDLPIGNALVNMYGKHCRMEDAQWTFMHMPQHDVFSWTAIISAYAQNSQGDEAPSCFDHMLQQGVLPNTVTYLSLLSAASTTLDPNLVGVRIHARIVSSGFASDLNLGNSLVNMYGVSGSVQDTWDAFNKMPEQDIVSWNALISACAKHGHSSDAFNLYLEIHHTRVKPSKTTYVNLLQACMSQTMGMLVHYIITEAGFELDGFVGTAIVSMYGKYGISEDASTLFFSMAKKTDISWNVMILVYSQSGKVVEALELAGTMRQQGSLWSNITVVSILDICAQQGWLSEARRIHISILASAIELGTCIGNALINVYTKCCNFEGAKLEFDNLHSRDVISWASIIMAYTQEGHGLKALAMFSQMQKEGLSPDEITYISVLDACASQSKLTEGEYAYSCLIKQGYDTNPILATSMMNMYGRCGKLNAAQKVFDMLSEKSVVSWTTIISAHAYHGQGKEALQLFAQMRQGVAPDNATYLSILSACSHAGLVDEGNYFLACMKEEHNDPPSTDHYSCLIDLHGRAGRLDDAEEILTQGMVEDSSVESSMALLSACKHRGDVKCAERASKHLLLSDANCSSAYVMLSNIYASSTKGDDSSRK